MESMKIKRKPPQEMMKGGIRDRPLASWIRILGWFLSSQNSFTFCSVVAALWWTFIIASSLASSSLGSRRPIMGRVAWMMMNLGDKNVSKGILCLMVYIEYISPSPVAEEEVLVELP